MPLTTCWPLIAAANWPFCTVTCMLKLPLLMPTWPLRSVLTPQEDWMLFLLQLPIAL